MCSTAAKMGISAKGRQLMRKASVLVASFSAFVSAVTALPNSKPLVLILIGAPGSGKNTQSAYLQKVYEIPVISADQLVKANPDAVASM